MDGLFWIVHNRLHLNDLRLFERVGVTNFGTPHHEILIPSDCGERREEVGAYREPSRHAGTKLQLGEWPLNGDERSGVFGLIRSEQFAQDDPQAF